MTKFEYELQFMGIEEKGITEWLETCGYFTAPATTKKYAAYEGGLYDHSYAVAQSLLWLTESLKLK